MINYLFSVSFRCMRIFPSAPCVTRSSLETESATRVNTLAAKGCFIPIRWAFISAISSGASPTEYARITKRTGTATTANSRMASIPGGVYSSGNRERYASVISKTDTVLERIRSVQKVYLCRSLRKRQTERRRHIIYPQGFRT